MSFAVKTGVLMFKGCLSNSPHVIHTTIRRLPSDDASELASPQLSSVVASDFGDVGATTLLMLTTVAGSS